jgi:hypothetical protein
MSELLSFIRHTLTTLGGGLVAAGYLSADDLTTAAGAIAALVGVAWAVLSKRFFKKAA